jgi:hypothetical protein
MRVYLFDGVTFKYAGFYDCQESPLELGVYITPADSTPIEPPTFTELESCTWDGEVWDITTLPIEQPVLEYAAPPEPTKAELMAELAALTAKIQALGA